ncbi:MAG: RDD family protein [Bacillota bacterium]|nr:RDD family protein [Bacillota bacterium]
MNYRKADLFRRFLAALVDGIIAGIPGFIPVVGALVGAAYTLTKDALVYEITRDAQWKNRSIGKKLLGLEVVSLGGGDIDLVGSARRNITLAAGSLLAVIPVVGWAAGAVVGGILGILETVLVLVDPQGRRMGDRLANTQVVETQAVDPPQAQQGPRA